jgi:prophage regulatory protein
MTAILQLPAVPPIPDAKPAKPAIEPELIGARDTAKLCGIAISSWWRLHAAAKVPSPVRLGGRTLWRVAEIKLWVAAGCPDRKTWQAMQAARAKK